MAKGNCSNINRVILVIFLQALIHPVRPGLKYSWTLFPRFLNFDIKNDEYIGPSMCSATGPMHPDVGYSSLRMLGQSSSAYKPLSHVDIQVADLRKWDSFSLLTFVCITNDEGTIFQIQPNHTDSLYKYIGLFYNTTHMFVKTTDLQSNDDVTVTSDVPIPRNEWTAVGVAYERGNDEMELFVGANVTGPVVLTTELGLWFPGPIRIGSGFSPEAGDATGLITCFNIYDSDIKISDVASALEDCHILNWPSSFIDAFDGAVLGSCMNHTGQFTLISMDTVPDSNALILEQRTTPSGIQCALWCSRNDSCSSFTISVLSRTCVLYRKVSYSLDQEAGTNHYVKNYLMECC